MKWPLVVLSVFAVLIGLIVGPTHVFAGWIAQMPRLVHGEAEAFQWLLAGASMLAALGGIAVAAFMYARPSNRPQLVRTASGRFTRCHLISFTSTRLPRSW